MLSFGVSLRCPSGARCLPRGSVRLPALASSGNASIATPPLSSLQWVVPLTGLFQGPPEGAGKLTHTACGLLGAGMGLQRRLVGVPILGLALTSDFP